MQMIAEEGRGALIYLHQTVEGFSVRASGMSAPCSLSIAKFRAPSPAESERKTQREIGMEPDSFRPGLETNPPAYQPSSKSRWS